MYSTVSTSRSSGGRVNAAFPPALSPIAPPTAPWSGALLVSELVAIRHLDYAATLSNFDYLRSQELHNPLLSEDFPHPFESTRSITRSYTLLTYETFA